MCHYGPNSDEKLTKYEIRSSHYLPNLVLFCSDLLQLCEKRTSNQTITHRDITFQRIGGYRTIVMNAFGCYLVIDKNECSL